MNLDKVNIKLDLFYRNKKMKWIDLFMHSADVFEKGKQLCAYTTMNFVVQGSLPDTDKLISKIVEFYKLKKGEVIFIGVSEIGGVKPDVSKTIFLKGVQSLSMIQGNSLKWGLFKDALELLGYTVETDELMNVIKVN